MASNLTIQKDSALPQQQQITIMTQEVLRILRNTHPNSGDFWKQDLTDFMQRMKNSSWPEQIRLRVLKAGIVGWCRILSKEINMNEPRYRSVDYKKDERQQAKKDKKENWFKSPKLPPELQPNSVLIIDASPGSQVLKIFENEIKKTKLKIRCIERPGPKIQYTAVSTFGCITYQASGWRAFQFWVLVGGHCSVLDFGPRSLYTSYL
jgi:hypothetical protein